ncbi:hypothetical protein Pint_27280 [Pistacia integerrima]|uniref:Uncharacterized protein n=1 Tax=Pistacia integerrima TaxID=434235 RepID=A0ACC0YML6_9ROSI|nr:hypothetical protein Pint_27280 [Pistacia integerrima]
MEGSSVVSRIDRKSSIETEPRTLSIDQIQYAREAALYVLNTMSIEEAMNVFMKVCRDWKPVESGKKQDGERMMEIGEELQYLEDELQCPLLKDVASAPF